MAQPQPPFVEELADVYRIASSPEWDGGQVNTVYARHYIHVLREHDQVVFYVFNRDTCSIPGSRRFTARIADEHSFCQDVPAGVANIQEDPPRNY